VLQRSCAFNAAAAKVRCVRDNEPRASR